MSELTLQEKLEWALMTIRERLTFGMGEEEGIKRRELRVKGVLIEAVKELPIIQQELSTAQKRIKELESVLAFYADKESWQTNSGSRNLWNAIQDDDLSKVTYGFMERHEVGGKRAREVLSNNKDLIEKLTKE